MFATWRLGGKAFKSRGHTWLKMSHESDARFRLRTSASSSAAAAPGAARDSSTCCSCESTECGAHVATVHMLAIRMVMADAISYSTCTSTCSWVQDSFSARMYVWHCLPYKHFLMKLCSYCMELIELLRVSPENTRISSLHFRVYCKATLGCVERGL